MTAGSPEGRRLAVILTAAVSGSSHLMAEDEKAPVPRRRGP